MVDERKPTSGRALVSIHVLGPDLSDFLFGKRSQKLVRDSERKVAEGPKNFLGEFFFPKTSNLLRRARARSAKRRSRVPERLLPF